MPLEPRVKRVAVLEKGWIGGGNSVTTLGNEIESVVLDRAVQWHAEHRIFDFAGRTLVLK